MKRTWTIIGVTDVLQSFRWYQSLLGLPETAPAHDLPENRFVAIQHSICCQEAGSRSSLALRRRFYIG